MNERQKKDLVNLQNAAADLQKGKRRSMKGYTIPIMERERIVQRGCTERTFLYCAGFAQSGASIPNAQVYITHHKAYKRLGPPAFFTLENTGGNSLILYCLVGVHSSVAPIRKPRWQTYMPIVLSSIPTLQVFRL